jgi:ABC-type sugar transport system ATPase subunit
VRLLEITRLAKSYGGAPALRDASLTVGAGEVVALMGENGAGKSTLIKILAGAVPADSGDIRLDGAAAAAKSPRDAHRLGLRFIHQELAFAPSLSVAENIFLGRRYPRRLGAFVDWRELHARARAALDALGVTDVRETATMGRLPLGDRMLVKIAATFLEDEAAPARLFVMDEPTAALSNAEAQRLFRVIGELKRRGCGILYVSHRIDEVLALADRLVVLRDGQTQADLPAREIGRVGLIELMTGRSLGAASAARVEPRGAVALAARGLSGGGLDDVSFEVREGEILGIAGLAESGQDQLLAALMGGAGRGVIEIGGRAVRVRDPARAWKLGLAYVPRERRSQGLFLGQDIIRNVVLPHLGVISRLGVWLDRRAERERTVELGRRVRLKAASPRQRVWRLSGGNQQKVMFARAVAAAPRVLLLEEPSRGVDAGAKFDIHVLLRELVGAGAAILVASSQLDELIEVCSRILVLRAGRVAETVSTEGLSEARLLALCHGAAA